MLEPNPLTDVVNNSLAERQALERVLQSPLFQRAPSLSRILVYICDQYFKGTADKLKEYNIAVEALGRPTTFDPQVDAIVRVDLHALRKRLKAFYAESGQHEELQIVLRTGCYSPEFVAVNSEPSHAWSADTVGETKPESVTAMSPPAAVAEFQAEKSLVEATASAPLSPRVDLLTRIPRWWQSWPALAMYGMLILVVGFVVGVGWFGTRSPWLLLKYDLPRPAKMVTATLLQVANLGSSPDSLLDGIRIRCGSTDDYTDSAGLRWQHDVYFTGGSSFVRPVDAIVRSTDPKLYSAGRQGIFQYDIPVPRGLYEVHLLFAETQSGIEDGLRQVFYTVGLGQADTIDIVSDAGGVKSATERVYANVSPNADGTIHLKFWSLDSILNAIEILPEQDGKPEPIRISAQSTLYQDISGAHWLPDRFYRGGHNGTHEYSRNRPDPPLFSHERYGRFDYSIPVAKGFKYQLTLYMAERYWGVQYSGLGGPGSRLFTVRCNGITLLSKFDIAAAQQQNDTIAVRFRDLEPDETGKLNLSFVPVVNHPLINAIEVLAE